MSRPNTRQVKLVSDEKLASDRPLLSIRNLKVAYGAVQALKGIDLDVMEGEIVTIVGANGAGKSTLLMSIFGSPRAYEGSVTFDGADITRLSTHEIARMSIAQAPEGRRIFPRMTVHENLIIGARPHTSEAVETLETVLEIFPRLRERLQQRGGTLSGGEQQMLAIGRALMGRPRLLILDEPSLGLAPLICKQIFKVIRDLNRQQGMTVLLVEQNAHHALSLAHRAYVMVVGSIALSGTGQELLRNPEVQAAYLEGGR